MNNSLKMTVPVVKKLILWPLFQNGSGSAGSKFIEVIAHLLSVAATTIGLSYGFH